MMNTHERWATVICPWDVVTAMVLVIAPLHPPVDVPTTVDERVVLDTTGRWWQGTIDRPSYGTGRLLVGMVNGVCTPLRLVFPAADQQWWITFEQRLGRFADQLVQARRQSFGNTPLDAVAYYYKHRQSGGSWTIGDVALLTGHDPTDLEQFKQRYDAGNEP